MRQEELQIILEKHKKWLNNEEGGERADLIGADLRFADLRGAILTCAILTYANLRGADLRGAILTGAILTCADLRGAILSGAILYGADLRGAILSGAILYGADLSGANLSGADLDEKEQYRLGVILKKKVVGYKKCKDNIIVKVEIPSGAVVFGINGRKFRTNKAKVIEISDEQKSAISTYDANFIYELGKTYTIKDFNLMYNVECGKGIHFFKTKKEAKDY